MQQLKDSLLKRNPNSVASLIQAATITDSDAILRNNELLQVNNELKHELSQLKQQFELRLRSLRVEHERIKVQYEQQVQHLQEVIDNNTRIPRNMESNLKFLSHHHDEVVRTSQTANAPGSDATSTRHSDAPDAGNNDETPDKNVFSSENIESIKTLGQAFSKIRSVLSSLSFRCLIGFVCLHIHL